MAMTLEQLRAMLAADEPDYAGLARLGPQVLPHLRKLIASPDEGIASKAASLASRINDDRAVDVLRDAANSPSSLVRLAVAGGVSRVTRPAASAVLMALLSDRDAGVRKLAIKSSVSRDNAALLAKIGDLSRSDPTPTVRLLAAKVVSAARGGKGPTGLA